MAHNDDDNQLVLAAEDCEPSSFARLHRFSPNDERVIGKLMAHGPVLLEGGRGSGKSALMLEAARRLAPANPNAGVFGVYMSLRHLQLLQSEGPRYEQILCDLVSREFQRLLKETTVQFNAASSVTELQYAIATCSRELGRRIVLFFDDAAHIGREASLGDFFDIFRTLSSSTVSCKAAIYPGVTNFGTRFDVYNDATVVNVVRDEDQDGFASLFLEVMRARFPSLLQRELGAPITGLQLAGFLGRSVLGNMRGFIFACNRLVDLDDGLAIGTLALGRVLVDLATNYYWPLLEEVKPKLGKYVPMVDPAFHIAEVILRECGSKGGKRTVLVHRDIVNRLGKPFEILEYAGFIAKRESSRALKSGGRGVRFSVNLSILLEQTAGARLTTDLYERWIGDREDPIEFHVKGTHLSAITNPELEGKGDLGILHEPIEKLAKSRAYPYGLTEQMIRVLRDDHRNTVEDLTRATDDDLDRLPYIGEAKIRRIRSTLGQAIWM